MVLIALMLAAQSPAQPPHGEQRSARQADDRLEAIEARRIAYITSRLSLTREESRLFWPVYAEYNQRIEELSAAFRARREELPEVELMSEQEAGVFVEAELSRFEEAAALRREYTAKMAEIISTRQIAMLFEAERAFNRMLFREAQRRQRHGGRGGDF